MGVLLTPIANQSHSPNRNSKARIKKWGGAKGGRVEDAVQCQKPWIGWPTLITSNEDENAWKDSPAERLLFRISSSIWSTASLLSSVLSCNQSITPFEYLLHTVAGTGHLVLWQQAGSEDHSPLYYTVVHTLCRAGSPTPARNIVILPRTKYSSGIKCLT